MPWESGSGEGKYQYHPGGDASAAPKDAPSAVNVVIVPNVNLPKVRCLEFMFAGRTRKFHMLTPFRSFTTSGTSGARTATRFLFAEQNNGGEVVHHRAWWKAPVNRSVSFGETGTAKDRTCTVLLKPALTGVLHQPRRAGYHVSLPQTRKYETYAYCINTTTVLTVDKKVPPTHPFNRAHERSLYSAITTSQATTAQRRTNAMKR
jgi:hypothetical protein